MKTLRTWPRSTARGLLVLLTLCVPSMAQEIPTQELGKLIEYAKLSAAVYDGTLIPADAWKRRDGGETWSGLKWALYERKTADGTAEHVLAFAGTEDLRDWAANIDQAFQADWFSVPALQYREALRIATQHVQALDRAKHVPLVIVGHSLGGGLAQYTALKLGTKAVVFNAAALGPETVQDIAPHLREAAGRNILHLHMRGDPVHEPTRAWLHGKHYGTAYVLAPALGTPGIVPIDIPWLAFVSPRAVGHDKLARHDIRNVISALAYQQAYGEIQKQVLQGQTRESEDDRTAASPAGVHMAPQPENVGHVGDELRKTVLDSRPAQETLFWKIELPNK